MIRDLRKGRVSLEEVNSSLDDVVRDSATGTRRIEASFDHLAEATRRIEPDKNLAKPMRHATEDVSEGVHSMRENTASNLKEVAASFDGTTQGISDGVQGLLAELLEGFGPGGLIAGALAAAGLGILQTQLQAGQEQADEAKQSAAELAKSWIEAGTNGKRTLQQVSDELKDMAAGGKDSAVSLTAVREQAKTLGVPFRDLAQAYAAGGNPLDNLIRKTKDLIGAETERLRGLDGSRGLNVATSDVLGKLREQEASLERVRAETKAAAQAERDWLASGGDELDRKATATQSYADSIQGSLADAGTDWDTFKGKEGGLSLDKYLAVMRAKADAVVKYQRNMGTASELLNADALAYIESLGIDAAPLLDKFVHAPLDKQAALADIWAKLGKSSGQAFNNSVQDKLNGWKADPLHVPVIPVLDQVRYKNTIAAIQGKPIKVPLSVSGPLKGGYIKAGEWTP